MISLGTADGFQIRRVPVEFFADAEGDVSEQRGFTERAGVGEIAGGSSAGFDGLNPFLVMADRVGNRRFWRREIRELRLGQEHAAAVIDEEISLLTDEENAAAPFVEHLGGELVGGAIFALIPSEAHGRLLAARGISVVNFQVDGDDLGINLRAFGFDGGRVFQVERPVRDVGEVAPKIRERAAAERPEMPPVKRHVLGLIRAVLNRSEPLVVIEIRGRVRWIRRENFVAVNRRGPDVDFRDFADRAGSDEFHDAAVVAAGVDLIAHLRDAFQLARGVGHEAHFGYRARERLLAINVAAAAERADDADGVIVIGRADDHGVDVLLFEHPAEVAVALRAGKFLADLLEVEFIDIANGDNVFVLHPIDVARAAAGDADAGDVQFAVGRAALLRAQNRRRGGESCGDEGGLVKKGAAANG